MTSSLNEGGTAVFRPSWYEFVFYFWRYLWEDFLSKQKFRLGGERFDIKDEMGNVAYQVEGSFFKIPKTFTIFDNSGEQVSEISKEMLTFMPRFEIQLSNGDQFLYPKEVDFL